VRGDESGADNGEDCASDIVTGAGREGGGAANFRGDGSTVDSVAVEVASDLAAVDCAPRSRAPSQDEELMSVLVAASSSRDRFLKLFSCSLGDPDLPSLSALLRSDELDPVLLGSFLSYIPLSKLTFLGGETIRICEGAFLMLLPLLERLKTGSVVVNGGLGGAAPASAEGYRRSGVPLARCSVPKSVGSGVYSDRRGLTTSSRLPTASLLCFVENFG
jgi:hypothetical protein